MNYELPEWSYLFELYLRQRYADGTRGGYKSRLAAFFNSGQEPEEFIFSANGKGEFNNRRNALACFHKFCQKDPDLLNEWFGEGFELPKSQQFDSAPPLYLDAKQMRELLDRMFLQGRREHIILVLAYCGGLRACEIRKLDCGDVHGQGDLLHLDIRESKYGHSRQVPLDNYASRHVTEWLAGRVKLGAASDWPLIAGHQSPRKKLATWTTFKDALRGCLAEMGMPMPAAPLHNWRHIFATHLAERNMPVRGIQMSMGHRNLGTTQRYIDFSLQHLQKQIQAASAMAEVEAERTTAGGQTRADSR